MMNGHKTSNASLSRRNFLSAALAAGTALPATDALLRPLRAASRGKSPNERLNLAVIGLGGQGLYDLHEASTQNSVPTENVVAICDVDAAHLDRAVNKYPHLKPAKRFDDYRRVLDLDNLDGVVVATPDFAHAIVVVAALKRRLPVYSEKPLTKTIAELRTLLAASAQSGVPTQTGNQIHAGRNYRRAVDIVRAGVLGPVRRVYIWQKTSVRGLKLAKNPSVPPSLNYDLWLGPVSYRPFNPAFFHFDWRYWWDFGGGHLADFCCHYMDVPFWALDLKYPTSIQAWGKKTHDGDNNMPDAMRVEYEFAARGDKPPVHLTWYQGIYQPEWVSVYDKKSAVLFEGENGRLLVDYGSRKLFLEPGLESHDVPQVIPDSPGHHKEWTNAIKTGSKTSSPFEYGGLLTESGLLGNVSYRAGQKKLVWDPIAARVTNCPEADQYLHSEYRAGWSL
jgi:predicted dehydrogenase